MSLSPRTLQAFEDAKNVKPLNIQALREWIATRTPVQFDCGLFGWVPSDGAEPYAIPSPLMPITILLQRMAKNMDAGLTMAPEDFDGYPHALCMRCRNASKGVTWHACSACHGTGFVSPEPFVRSGIGFDSPELAHDALIEAVTQYEKIISSVGQ